VESEKHASVKKVLRSFYQAIALFSKEFSYPECSLNEAIVIGIIGRNPGIDAQAISSLVALDKGYLSHLLLALEKKGVIIRKRIRKPQPQKAITLTAKGERFARETAAILDRSIEKRLALLSADEQRDFSAKLDGIKADLDRMMGGKSHD
jgi:DNA-binding MarR family transcriptional regulator